MSSLLTTCTGLAMVAHAAEEARSLTEVFHCEAGANLNAQVASHDPLAVGVHQPHGDCSGGRRPSVQVCLSRANRPDDSTIAEPAIQGSDVKVVQHQHPQPWTCCAAPGAKTLQEVADSPQSARCIALVCRSRPCIEGKGFAQTVGDGLLQVPEAFSVFWPLPDGGEHGQPALAGYAQQRSQAAHEHWRHQHGLLCDELSIRGALAVAQHAA
mmetsp:Transcript_78347/g.253775  ORF Transcript_78347/g.253775 Transcript_78347/m.253775 type:complete len:212 (-) Transcript_78347:281-916(-)